MTGASPEESAKEVASEQGSGLSSFIGVALEDHQGLVDTAAQEGLVGKNALLKYLGALRPLGLRGHWVDKPASARGIGGNASVVGVCELPVGLAGVPGVLEVTVVAEDVPLLIPISLLKALGAVINIPKSTIQLLHVQADTVMHSLGSRHLAISIMEFGPKGWQFPEACKAVRQERDFRTSSQQVSVQKRCGPSLMRPHAPLSLFGHACVPSASCGAAPGKGSASSGNPARTSRKSRTQSLAHRVGQALLCLAVGPLSNGHLGLDVCFGDQFGGKPGKHYHNALGDHLGGDLQGQLLQELPGEEPRAAHQSERSSDQAFRGMPPRSTIPQRRGQWTHELGSLQSMPEPLEAVPEICFDSHWEGPGGDHRELDTCLGQSQGQASASADASNFEQCGHGQGGEVPSSDSRSEEGLGPASSSAGAPPRPGAEDACLSLEMVLDSMMAGEFKRRSGRAAT